MNFENLWIVITTINSPTEAILKYIELSKKFGFRVLIVGDEITPTSYADLDCEFLSIDKQRQIEEEWGQKYPSRHYARKNFGYYYAASKGADFVFDTDDDNLPYNDFTEFLLKDFRVGTPEKDGFVNVYRFFVDAQVWPRGFPLRCRASRA